MEYFSNKGKEGIRIMKKIRLLLTHLLITAMIMASASPAYVYADELVPIGSSAEISDEAAEGDVEILSGDTDAEDISVSEDVSDTEVLDSDSPEGDEALSDGFFADGAGTITKIEAPKKTEYVFDYKIALVSLVKDLPKKIKVYRGNNSENLSVTWKCEVNYSKEFEEYPFVPDMKGFTLAKDVKLPRIIVRFKGDRPEMPTEQTVLYDEVKAPTLYSVNAQNQLDMGSLPKKYNNKKQFPKVRNQGNYGSCWAHAAMGAIEGDLIMDGAPNPKSIDYSELQLAYYRTHKYTDPKGCRTDSMVASTDSPKVWLNFGSGIREATHLLSNHIGAVEEKLAPYSKPDAFKGGSEYLTSKDGVHVKNAYYIGAEDLEGIKRAIVQHGGVSAGYFHDDSCYDAKYNSFYNPVGTANGHQITIVGWDDTFSKDHFNSTRTGAQPKKDGAWLIRNSWGYDDYDLFGYFWMSYYEPGIKLREFVVAFDTVKATDENVYAYDGQCRFDVDLNCGKAVTIKETYKVSGGEAVKSIGFETKTPDVNAKITVKNTKTGETSKATVNTSYAGFYTVKLQDELYVPSKATVELIIAFSSKNDILLTCENRCEVKQSAGAGGYVLVKGVCDNSFYYRFNDSDEFTKFVDKDDPNKQGIDPRMKLYTIKSSGPKKVKVTGVTLDKTSKTLKVGKTLKLTATVKPKNATNKKVTWKSSNKKVAKVSSKGKVTALKKGEATITVTTADGNKKAKCKIKVKKK